MGILNLYDLLVHEVNDLYSAEEQIIEALPKMAQETKNRELKAALNQHLKITREQKKRLDKVRKLLKTGEASEEKKGFWSNLFGGETKCKGTEGLITEGEKIMGEAEDAAVKDAAIIASSQKIEHYEISGYGTARAYAKELGLKEVARLLEVTLKEEKEADTILTRLALNKVNVKAEPGVKSGTANGRQTASKKAASKSPGKNGSASKGSKRPAGRRVGSK